MKIKYYDKVAQIKYTFDTASKTAIVRGTRTDVDIEQVVIPDVIVYDFVPYTVSEIEEKAFFNKFFLKTVKLPYTVTTIKASAFMNCTQLETFESKADELKIHEKAFAQCVSMTSFEAKVVQLVGECVFQNCRMLDFNGVKFYGKIPEHSFWRCSKIIDLKFAADVEIARSALLECHSLMLLTFLGNANLEDGTLEGLKNVQIRCPTTSNLVNLAFDGCDVLIF